MPAGRRGSEKDSVRSAVIYAPQPAALFSSGEVVDAAAPHNFVDAAAPQNPVAACGQPHGAPAAPALASSRRGAAGAAGGHTGGSVHRQVFRP